MVIMKMVFVCIALLTATVASASPISGDCFLNQAGPREQYGKVILIDYDPATGPTASSQVLFYELGQNIPSALPFFMPAYGAFRRGARPYFIGTLASPMQLNVVYFHPSEIDFFCDLK